MKTYFTIDEETNSITVHDTAKEAEAVANAEHFRNEAGLAKLAANWPTARLVEIWNSLPGAIPLKKFTDRKKAVTRIWAAIQTLSGTAPDGVSPATEPAGKIAKTPVGYPAKTTAAPTVKAAPVTVGSAAPDRPVASQTPNVASSEAPASQTATRLKKTPKLPAKGEDVKPAREGSKTETILGLMKQPGGATVRAIMDATGWQAHSVRGFVSGTLGKKMGLTVHSIKGEDGQRSYSIKA